MDFCLRDHVPSMYFEAIACHCHVKAIAFQGVSDIVVVCMSNGTLIEFSDKEVLKTCEIKDCVPENVEFFICYKPFSVFYVVKSKTNVYIVKREKYLKVSHTFSKVKNVVKDDFWKVGSPQIGLWYCDKEVSEHPHFVTDLSDSEPKNEGTSSTDQFSAIYYERLKEVRMKSLQLKQNLEEKRKLRYNCVQQLVKSELEEDLCAQLEDDLHLVTVLGEKNASTSKSQKSGCPRLEMRKVWKKIHNDKWIVGVQVVNKGKM
ncbi:hypothetical protein R5R35_006015 [Gryllus longicercus]|uniref:Uncharacterized protein n=1 Tax=Gryllus longicercus TaxID=2509291 RepID=A0AAN9W0I5_9ORTH